MKMPAPSQETISWLRLRRQLYHRANPIRTSIADVMGHFSQVRERYDGVASVEYTNAPIDCLAYNVTDVVQAKQAFSRDASIHDAVESTSVMTKTSYKFAHEKLLLDQLKCLIGS